MFKNWKTSLAGLSAILGGIVAILKGDLSTGATAVVTGVGLLFAKDSDVTGKP